MVTCEKSPELRPPGFFYSVSDGWLRPKADYLLFVSVQPFANAVATTLAKTEIKKDENKSMVNTPFPYLYRGR